MLEIINLHGLHQTADNGLSTRHEVCPLYDYPMKFQLYLLVALYRN